MSKFYSFDVKATNFGVNALNYVTCRGGVFGISAAIDPVRLDDGEWQWEFTVFFTKSISVVECACILTPYMYVRQVTAKDIDAHGIVGYKAAFHVTTVPSPI